MADARQVQIRVADGLPHVRLDAGRAELVLMNLIANAIKYSDPGKPARIIDVEGSSQDGTVSILIRDNGLGIPEERLAGIFEQFVRAHSERDEELGAQGLGLGLAIVRELGKMGARIEERPDGLVPGLGGQTGLNLATRLATQGILDRYGVQLLGTPLKSIRAARCLMRAAQRPSGRRRPKLPPMPTRPPTSTLTHLGAPCLR